MQERVAHHSPGTRGNGGSQASETLAPQRVLERIYDRQSEGLRTAQLENLAPPGVRTRWASRSPPVPSAGAALLWATRDNTSSIHARLGSSPYKCVRLRSPRQDQMLAKPPSSPGKFAYELSIGLPFQCFERSMFSSACRLHAISAGRFFLASLTSATSAWNPQRFHPRLLRSVVRTAESTSTAGKFSSQQVNNGQRQSLESVFSLTWTGSSLLYFANIGQAAFQLVGKIFRLGRWMHWLASFCSEPGVQLVGRSGDEPALPVNRHSLTRPSLNHGDRFT